MKMCELFIGAFVMARSNDTLTPVMRVYGLWEDTVYLKIDSEQGDPYEYSINEIVPCAITRDFLKKNFEGSKIYGIVSLKDVGHNTFSIVKNRCNDDYYVRVSNDENIHTIVFEKKDVKYIHELQRIGCEIGLDFEI